MLFIFSHFFIFDFLIYYFLPTEIDIEPEILKSYKFTITENTPIEEDVALDPELLGKVFENLLAEYNPETQKTARKATGSYYTPREIVNYMVDESLIEYLKNSISECSRNEKQLDEDLHILLSFNPINPFKEEPEIQEKIIRALDRAKILDPAVGSGAFLMGVLHKLVHILHKLDYQNLLWKDAQIKQAEKISAPEIRKETLEYIEEIFDEQNNFADFSRKLYLIQKCIYGVDIQQIAVQIAKLRFFISLLIDQKVVESKPNRGIHSLPNMETKIVAANTLIKIDLEFGGLFEQELRAKEDELKKLRESYFNARTRREKLDILKKDLKIRKELKDLLREAKVDSTKAEMLANWDPYDQNASATFFDPEWMFGIKDGFDILIGNPPYVSTRTKDFDKLHKPYFKSNYRLAIGQYDLFTLFIEKANNLIKPTGIVSFIVPKRLLTNENFKEVRKFLLNNLPIKVYVDAQMPFENVGVEANIILSTKKESNFTKTYIFNGFKFNFNQYVSKNLISFMPFNIFPFNISPISVKLINKILTLTEQRFSDYVNIIRGMECGFNHPSISNKKGNYKIIKGEHISKYVIKDTTWFIDTRLVSNKIIKSKNIYLNTPKLVAKFISNKLEFAFDNYGYFNTNVVYNIHPKKGKEKYLKFLLGLCNSKLIDFWFFNTFINDDKLFPHIQKNQLESIPIIVPSRYKLFERIVDKILINKHMNINNDTKKLENKIDILVYKLYELTYEEVKVIDPEIEKIISREEYEKLTIKKLKTFV